MRKIKLVGVFILFIFLTGLTVSGGINAEPFNRVVALVNDDVITLHELNKKIKEVAGVNPDDLRDRDEAKFLDTRRQVLEMLVDEKITQEKVKELGINITPERIDAAIERIKKDNRITHEDLIASLKNQGITYEEYREGIKKEIERANLINLEVKSKIIIREKTISQYYEKHKSDFESEGEVHLAGIFLLRRNPKDRTEQLQLHQKSEKILDKLRQGADFVQMAKQYSDGPGADEGGDLGTFKMSQLEPELKKILEGMVVGGYSDLIIRPNGIQIIKLVGRQHGELKTIDDARDAVYGILYKEEVNRRFTDWLMGLREKSYTKIIF